VIARRLDVYRSETAPVLDLLARWFPVHFVDGLGDVDAVTGACLMTRMDLFLKLGGMDEVNFPVAFNDSDYCLKARKAGWRVVCASGARLYHHELATRGPTWKPWDLWRLQREKRAFRKQWLDKGFPLPFTTSPS
jgi:GT2 family glycosyltransferase